MNTQLEGTVEKDAFMYWYSRALIAVVLVSTAWWISSFDWDARRLNGILRDDAILETYPYKFRVKRVDDGVAVVTTPRSPSAPAMRFLQILKPRLAGRDSGDPALQAAQEELAKIQAHVKELVVADAKVTNARWELDRAWYESRGLSPEAR